MVPKPRTSGPGLACERDTLTGVSQLGSNNAATIHSAELLHGFPDPPGNDCFSGTRSSQTGERIHMPVPLPLLALNGLAATQLASRLALYFGTSWLVNSVALTAILLVLVLANFYVSRRRSDSLPSYAVLVLFLLANYFFPWHRLSIPPGRLESCSASPMRYLFFSPA